MVVAAAAVAVAADHPADPVVDLPVAEDLLVVVALPAVAVRSPDPLPHPRRARVKVEKVAALLVPDRLNLAAVIVIWRILIHQVHRVHEAPKEAHLEVEAAAVADSDQDLLASSDAQSETEPIPRRRLRKALRPHPSSISPSSEMSLSSYFSLNISLTSFLSP